jgi:hypothetical protein
VQLEVTAGQMLGDTPATIRIDKRLVGPLTGDQRNEIKDLGIESHRSRHLKQGAARDFHDVNKQRHRMQAGIPLPRSLSELRIMAYGFH